jgi:hypothetical protein
MPDPDFTAKVTEVLYGLGFVPAEKILNRVDLLADEFLGPLTLTFDGESVRGGGLKQIILDTRNRVDSIEPQLKSIDDRLGNGLRMRFGAKEWAAILAGIIGLLTNIAVTLGGAT